MSKTTSATKRVYDRESYILIVDDDQTLLKFFKIHLNKFFSRVIVVKNAKEALDTLKTKQIDLVLTDIRMPRVDGLELLQKIRGYDASIPVYLISGGVVDESMQAQIEALADGFMKKPFGVDEIQSFIDSGMKKRATLKELAEVAGSNKKLIAVLSGDAAPSKKQEKRVKELLDQLKAS